MSLIFVVNFQLYSNNVPWFYCTPLSVLIMYLSCTAYPQFYWLCALIVLDTLRYKTATRPIFCCKSHTKTRLNVCGSEIWIIWHLVMIYYIQGKYWASFYHSKPRDIMQKVWAASVTGSLIIIFQLWPCQIQTDNSHQIKELSLSWLCIASLYIYHFSFLGGEVNHRWQMVNI